MPWAVEDDGGGFGREGRQDRGVDPAVEPDQGSGREGQCREQRREVGSSRTVTVPASVRARKAGRYMSSMLAAGRWKRPGETARIK